MSKLGDRLSARREVYEEMPEQEDELYDMPQRQQLQVRKRSKDDDEEVVDRSPLAIVNEIKEEPSEKGTLKTFIGGTPVDLHILEDYLVKTSPFALKTVMRYHNARNMEEIKNYSRGPNVKVNSKFWIMIIVLIGVVCLGLFMIMFLPKILQSFQMGGF